MEKVKIELPKKYRIGINTLVPLLDSEDIKNSLDIIGAIVDKCGNGEIDKKKCLKSFRDSGRAIISLPLIHSIAETKMDGLNSHFRDFMVPFEAFLERED